MDAAMPAIPDPMMSALFFIWVIILDSTGKLGIEFDFYFQNSEFFEKNMKIKFSST